MAKSKEELIYDIENELVDPTTNKITGERVKARLLDMVETMSESAGSKLTYRDVSSASLSEIQLLAHLCPLIKYTTSSSGITIFPGSAASLSDINILAIAYDINARFYQEGEILTMEGLFTEIAVDPTLYPEITEEEFYTVE